MVPTPGAGGSALEKNLRFLVLVREREEEIELERDTAFKKGHRLFMR
jgi:hypothetical protein